MNDIEIYSANVKDPNKPKLAIKFTNTQDRAEFVNIMIQEGKTHGQDLSSVLDSSHDGNSNVLYINPSHNKGLGTYISANGELAINWGSPKLAQRFQDNVGLEDNHTQRFGNALYIKKNVLPPKADNKSKINSKFYKTKTMSLHKKWEIDAELDAKYGLPFVLLPTKKVLNNPQIFTPSTPSNRSPVRGNIEIYSANVKDPNQPKLAIKFTNMQERDKFVNKMIEEGKKYGQDLTSTLDSNHDGNPQVLYVNPSNNRSLGTYISANGELSMNWGSPELAKSFQTSVGLQDNNTQRFGNALYIKKNILSPKADGKSKITITKTPTTRRRFNSYFSK